MDLSFSIVFSRECSLQTGPVADGFSPWRDSGLGRTSRHPELLSPRLAIDGHGFFGGAT